MVEYQKKKRIKIKVQNRRKGDIEDIYFFEVNIKYISSSVLKTSEISWVRSTNKISMFSTHEMKYIWYLLIRNKFSFYFILFWRFTVNKFVNHASSWITIM